MLARARWHRDSKRGLRADADSWLLILKPSPSGHCDTQPLPDPIEFEIQFESIMTHASHSGCSGQSRMSLSANSTSISRITTSVT